jgi:hypothetical protein
MTKGTIAYDTYIGVTPNGKIIPIKDQLNKLLLGEIQMLRSDRHLEPSKILEGFF